MSEGQWSGALASCQAGDIDAQGRDNALRVVNLHRWLADLPPVQHDGARNDEAQKCALMMHANNMISHAPAMDWACYSTAGAEAAGNSNIATTAGVAAVDLYMLDPGNDNTLGHRRWILSNLLGPIGLGSTSEFSCMWVLAGGGAAGQPWTAWPPPGEVPFEVVQPVSWSTLDETGWSIQSDDIDLTAATVTISDGGVDQPVTVTQLAQGYGSQQALRILPQGWTSHLGHDYHVRVTGVVPIIDYEVTFVACP